MGDGLSSAVDQLIGALLTGLGAGVTVLGLNLMKYQQTRHGKVPWRMENRQARRRWVGSFFVWLAGQATQTTGTYFATVSVCSAVANIAVGVNAFIAHRMFGERFHVFPPKSSDGHRTWADWDLGGVIVMLAGAALVVLAAPALGNDDTFSVAIERTMLKDPHALVVVLLLGVGLIISAVPFSYLQPDAGKQASDRRCSPTVGTMARAMAFGLIAGACGGYAFLAVKLALACAHCFKRAWFYAMWIWGGAAQVLLVVSLNIGMVRLPMSSVAIVSTYYVSATIIASLMGLATFNLFGDFEVSTAAQFVGGLILCIIGVLIVSTGSVPTAKPKETGAECEGSQELQATASDAGVLGTLQERLIGEEDGE